MYESSRTDSSHSENPAEPQTPGAQLVVFGWPGLAMLSAVIAIAAWFQLGAIVLLCSCIAAIGLVARGWAAVCLWGLVYTRRLSAERAFPGDSIRFDMTLDNRKPLPLAWVEATEFLPAALWPPADETTVADSKAVAPPPSLNITTSLGWYRTATLTRELICRRRGCFKIGPARIASADGFGLFVKSRIAAPAATLLVYPKLYALTDLGLPARQPLGATRDPQRLFADPSRIAGLRPYTPETPFNAIAWKATARTGQLQAKQYEPTVSLQTVVFLAVDSFPGIWDDDSFELAVSAVASVADAELRQRRSVGVFANGRKTDLPGPVAVPPNRALDQRTLVLEQLARLERIPTEPFAAFLRHQIAAFAGRTTLVVVAAKLDDATDAQLREFQRRGRPVVVLLAGDVPMPSGSVPCRRIGELLDSVAAA